MCIYHKHHIIPRHMGGTDDPSNIAILTVEEHAAAHKQLYKKYGKWQDYLAWKGLSGYLGKEDIIKEKQTLNGKERAKQNFTKPKTQKHKDKLSDIALTKTKLKCPHCGLEAAHNHLVQWHYDKCPSLTGKQLQTGPCTEKRRDAISKSRKLTKKVACIHCGKLADPGNLMRHHNDNCKFKK